MARGKSIVIAPPSRRKRKVKSQQTVDEFLAAGGEITVVDSGVSGQHEVCAKDFYYSANSAKNRFKR